VENFLKNPACPLPCWEKITPGETSMDTAREILITKSQVSITYDFKKPHNPPASVRPKVLEWVLAITNEKGMINGSYDNDIVQYIVLFADKSLSLSRLNDRYGPPSLIDFDSARIPKMCYTQFFYDKHGMIASALLPCKTTRTSSGFSIDANISEDILIESVNLSKVGSEFWNANQPVPPFAISWDGYRMYHYEPK
jgi:hypothetical protein